jgi:hypothetical protein
MTSVLGGVVRRPLGRGADGKRGVLTVLAIHFACRAWKISWCRARPLTWAGQGERGKSKRLEAFEPWDARCRTMVCSRRSRDQTNFMDSIGDNERELPGRRGRGFSALSIDCTARVRLRLRRTDLGRYLESIENFEA